MHLTPEGIKERLGVAEKDSAQPPRFSQGQDDPSQLQSAAVLLPLYREEGNWHLIFIKRTEHDQDDHSGQIAFPGGRVEEGDRSLIETALRETEEEIDLHPRDVEILGFSQEIVTVTHFRVTPLVGTFPWPYPLRPNPLEVKKILPMPLTWLADDDNYRVELWHPQERDVGPHPVIFFEPFKGEVLWGATAKIVLDFIKILKGSP